VLKSSLVRGGLVRSVLAIAILVASVPAIAAVATTTVVTVVDPQGSGNTTPTATSVYGQPVAVTVAVTADSGMAAPDGSVSVYSSSGFFYCTAILGSPVGLTATGTCNLPMPLTAGLPPPFTPYVFVASYTGTATFAASISNGVGNGSLTVNAATTVTTITAHTPNPSVVNSPIAVTATVTVMPPGVGTPNVDNISVFDGTVTCYMVGGSCNLTPITPGVKTLSARYNGDNNFTTSFSPDVSHTVTGGGGGTPTTTIVKAVTPQGSGNTTPTATSVYGQPVAVTVAVTAGSGMAAPDGSVSVYSNFGFFYCTAILGSPVGLTATGTCNLPMPLTAGLPPPFTGYVLVASYTGTATFASSISSGAGNGSLRVNAAMTVTTITAHTPNPSVVNSPIAVTVTVTVVPPGVGTPNLDNMSVNDGTVTCYMVGGSCNLTPITPGVKTLSARFTGDNNLSTTYSPDVSHTVTGGGGTTFTGPTIAPGVSGTVTLSGGGASCIFVSPAFIDVPPLSPPSGTTFPFGLFSFSTAGCTPGGTITIQIVYSQPLPAGAQYWKFGPTPSDGTPHWYVMPGATVSGATVTYAIQDGLVGDDDLLANGNIADPGGPGVSLPASSAAIPTVDDSALVLLALMIVVLAAVTLRQKQSR
jgi:hypothetical protein